MTRLPVALEWSCIGLVFDEFHNIHIEAISRVGYAEFEGGTGRLKDTAAEAAGALVKDWGKNSDYIRLHVSFGKIKN